MNEFLNVPARIVEETLAVLRAAGKRNSERVVLWLGRRNGVAIGVEEMLEPKQEASLDYFRIPPQGMNAVMDRLRAKGTMIAAQVHSHPMQAFHSAVDDRWAIVRHAGAISVVLPEFASRTTLQNFLASSATYRLDAQNRWGQVRMPFLLEVIRIEP